MAGTIPLSMTQQFTSQGVPLVGGKLYTFQTGTTIPQSAYQDSGLTFALPNPMTLDSSGRIPQFFLADGTIKARLTDAYGVVQGEWDNLLVIGPTGGGGGSGATVDPTAIFQTGDSLWLAVTGVRAGWVRDNGRTVGSAISGASERANADCQNLFTWLWTNYGNEICPVVGGRGANAAADWSGNKQITLPDMRGRMPCGLDDMGNAAASRFANVPFSVDGATTPGAIGGEALHTLSLGEAPKGISGVSDTRTWGVAVSVPGGAADSTVNVAPGPSGTPPANRIQSVPVQSGSIAIVDNAGGSSHNNMPPFVLGTFYRKL